MKRTLLFLLCVLMGTQVFSETEFGARFPTLAYLERTSCHYLEGEEQNRTLNRLKFEDNMFEIDGNYYVRYHDMWLREDYKGRILVYSEPAKKDLVLYDFTLEVGDTLTTLNIDEVSMTEGDPILPGLKPVVVDYPIEYYDEIIPIDTLIVTDVSMVMMCDSNQYKKWTFSNGMQYMENIGHLGADFFPIIRNPWEEFPACCIEGRLVCASIYDRLIYQMDDAEMQRLNAECQCSSWASKWCDTWNVLEFNGMAFEQTAQTWQYKLAYDTIIDGKEYQAVTRHWTADEEKTKEYVAAVRFEENSKAFIYYDNAEYLLYDFNFDLIEGDTLEVFAGINNYEHFNTYKCVIKSVEQTEGGITESTYSMDIIDPLTGKVFPSPMVWKEFVGSYNGILHGDLLVPGNSNYHLLCAYKNSSIVYSTEDEVFTDYGCEYNGDNVPLPEDLFPTLWGLQRTSCDEWFDGCEENKSYLFSPKEITEINGKQYLKCGGVFLREEDSKVLIYSFPYEKDLVLYDYTLEVGDTLQNLGIDIYSFPELEYAAVVDYIAYEDYDVETDEFIIKKEPLGSKRVTEVSTITLLDGKEYKRWLFGNDWENGNYYVEGIGNVGGSFGGDYINIANPYALPTCYMGERLVCVSKNNKLLYMMDDAEMERLGAECLCDVETSYKDQWCNKWNVMWFDGWFFDETASTSQYRLGKDTIIGDYTYSKFTSRTSVRFTSDRKVYVYYEGFDDNDPYSEDLPTGEYLAYDFSAKVGDTLEVFSGINNTYSQHKCLVREVQTDPETNLRTIKLYPIYAFDEHEGVIEDEITWIEGLGSSDGFLIGWHMGLVGGGTFALLCAYKDDELKYTGSFYERFGCDYNAGVVSDDLFPTLSGLQRTICREYYEQADNKTRMEQFTNLTTRTENGSPYIYCSPFLLCEKDNKILIYSRTLNKDLVLYDFNLEVGDSLPMLYIDFFAEDNWIADSDMEIWCIVDYHKDLEGNILPADTLIVTDVSAITLLDGKEYKKWTFNNGMEYVEGIGSFGNRQWSGDFFQLIANRDVPTSLLGEHLVCASKNGKLLYQMDNAEMERLGTECLCEVEKKWSDTWCDTWNVLELKYRYSSYTTKEDFETWRYYLAQDTIINNYTYTAVTRQTTKVPEGVYPFTIPEPEYVAAVRFTDDRKVYIYYDNTEYLLYDFNVQPGDELTVFAGINHYHSHHTNTIRVDEVERYPGIYPFGTEISLSVFPDFYGDERPACFGVTKWVEGVGDLCGFITGADCGLSEYQTALLCAYKDGNTEYRTEYEEYAEYGCEYNSGENKEYILTLPGLQRTGCTKTIGEDEYGTVWGARSYLMQEIETATIGGKQYLLFGTNNIYDEYCSLWLREENNKILVYSTAQKKDLVLYDFTLNVGDSLSRLYVDYELSSVVDYFKYEADWEYTKPLFVTEVSTITLLDGKEYKKWTFDNGIEYVEGIGSFGSNYGHNDFYQLIVNAPLYSDVHSQHLVCVSKNGQLLYKMDDAEMEQLETECLCEAENSEDLFPTLWGLQRTEVEYHTDGADAPSLVSFNEYTPTFVNGKWYLYDGMNYLREENNQVLLYSPHFEIYKDIVLYDWTLEVGDTLPYYFDKSAYKGAYYVVTNVSTITLLDGKEYKKWTLACGIEYIEGIGAINGEGYGHYLCLQHWDHPATYIDTRLVCASRNGQLLYQMDESEMAQLETECLCEAENPEDLFPTLWGLQRTVCNEYCGETEDDNSANNTYKQTFDKIFFENDKPYILCNDYLLREEDNKIFLYSQSLNKEIVLYDFTLEVGDSLPAYIEHFDETIYPADTLVVTDISSVTLLDGKEYKKWTFDNGMEYVEGIGMYGGRRNGNFFGLIQELVVPCHPGTHLVCVSKNNKLLYQMDEAEMERLGAECLCDYDRGPLKDNAKNGKIGGRPTPTQWNMLEVETKEMDGTSAIVRAETFSYTLENDSIVANNKTYYQLARQSTKDTAITKSFVGALHFGEDDGNRVYFLRDGVEYVLYDFTAEPGDTVETFAGINNYPQHTTYTHVVVDKDTTEDGACRMLLEVVFPDDTNTTAENAEKVWLAGLGSVDGIVHNAAKRTSNAHAAPSRTAHSSDTQSSVMLCAWREDSCLYTTDHPDYDSFGCVYNQDPTSVENTHSPLPMTDCYKLLRNGQLLIIHKGKTYNVLGVPVE